MIKLLPLDGTDKKFVRFVIAILIATVIAVVLYESLAHIAIKAMYDGRLPGSLSELIQYQNKHSLEHYLEIADGVFYRLLFVFSVHFVLICFLYKLFFSDKTLSVFWLGLTGVLAVMSVYMLNPYYRVYSNHGFFRAGIVYQILNGYVPPLDPLFAGELVHSPWGFLWLTANMSRLIQISPFYSFMLINIVSLVLSIVLVYKISQQLIRDEKANALSVIISIFGTTIFSRNTISTMLSCFHSGRPENRALPAAIKFSNVNGAPIGIVFFLLFVYAIIKLFANRERWSYAAVCFVSVLGCGFFYPPMLPGVIATVLAICLLGVTPLGRRLMGNDLKTVIKVIAASTMAIAAVIPHFLSISGVGSGMQLFNISHISQNLVNYLIPVSPLLVVIFINRRHLWEHLNRPVNIVLISVILANAGCYLVVHIPYSVEYKFLILSTVPLGILGGVAFRAMQHKWPRWVAFLLLLVFVFPSYHDIAVKLQRYGNKPILCFSDGRRFVEKGTDIFSVNKEEDQLYKWIKTNTATDDIFIDTEWTIPIFARRGLLVALDRQDDKKMTGYSLAMEDLKVRNGYGEDIFKQRKELVENIFGFDKTLTRKNISEQLSAKNIYVVVRTDTLKTEFDSEGFHEVFGSSQGSFKVFKAANRFD